MVRDENASRVFHATDAGKTWTASEAPLVTGLNQGVSRSPYWTPNRLAIVGGDYDHPQVVKPNSAYSTTAVGRGKKVATVLLDTAGASQSCPTRPVPPRLRLGQSEWITRSMAERTGSDE